MTVPSTQEEMYVDIWSGNHPFYTHQYQIHDAYVIVYVRVQCERSADFVKIAGLVEFTQLKHLVFLQVCNSFTQTLVVGITCAI